VADAETPDTGVEKFPRMLRPVLDPRIPLDPAARRRSRLLAAFLLVLVVVFGAVDVASLVLVPGYVPPWYGYAFLAGGWLLNRSGRYTAAAVLTLTMFPIVLLEMIRDGTSTHPELSLVYLAPGVLLASILLSARGTVLFAAASVATVLVAPFVATAHPVSSRDLISLFALVAIMGGLAVVSLRHRDRLERDRQAQLRDSEKRLRGALRAAHMATWEWELGADVVRWSEGAEAVLGLPQGGNAPATSRAYLELVHPDDRDTVQQALEAPLSGGSRRYSLRHRVRDGEGAVRWLEAHGRVDRDREGRPVRTRGTIMDVTDRQRFETEREALIHELEAKNMELERFTYTVSHDLKSPLITIRGFLGLVEKDVAEGRLDRLRGDIGRMTSATDAMQHLLHELLRLSRIGRIMNPSERVSFAAIASEAAELVRTRLDERGVRLEIEGGLPDVHCDRLRLVEVVQNLLENAAKFAGDEPAPVVVVGCRPGVAGSPPVLFVRDNGIGIDPRLHEKVFGLFEKLDPRAEGSGVGLALVKRIVEVHGGRVWIESEGRGRGTTVCFTLSVPPPE